MGAASQRLAHSTHQAGACHDRKVTHGGARRQTKKMDATMRTHQAVAGHHCGGSVRRNGAIEVELVLVFVEVKQLHAVGLGPILLLELRVLLPRSLSEG